MYVCWEDHNPPHCHAMYSEAEAWIVIADATVLEGSLSRQALRVVRT